MENSKSASRLDLIWTFFNHNHPTRSSVRPELHSHPQVSSYRPGFKCWIEEPGKDSHNLGVIRLSLCASGHPISWASATLLLESGLQSLSRRLSEQLDQEPQVALTVIVTRGVVPQHCSTHNWNLVEVALCCLLHSRVALSSTNLNSASTGSWETTRTSYSESSPAHVESTVEAVPGIPMACGHLFVSGLGAV